MAHASTKSEQSHALCSAVCRKRGRPRDEALHCRRCEEILCQSIEVFARLGYRNTDVQLIADPLRIAKGTIYRYFPSKEKLFLAAVERGVRQLDVYIHVAVDREGDPLRKIVVAVKAYLEFFDSHPELVELFVQERSEFRDRHKPIYFQVGEENEAVWRAMIQGLIDSGRLRHMPAERVKRVMGGVLYGTMFTNYLTNRQIPAEQQARDIVDVVFNGLLGDKERSEFATR
ncbi:MAG: TetR/AcrR family transcriptional regulator [Tepidisphaerales bacterium]